MIKQGSTNAAIVQRETFSTFTTYLSSFSFLAAIFLMGIEGNGIRNAFPSFLNTCSLYN